RNGSQKPLPDALSFAVQRTRGGDTVFVLFPGEMFSILTDELRAEGGDCLYVVGFANGYNGYLCPEQVYAEGGYEPDMAFIFGGIPRPRRGAHESVRAAAIRLLRM